MAKFDISVIGISGGNRECRVAASATRARVGEPINCVNTYTSGVGATNTVTQAVDATPNIGTATTFHVGIGAKDFEVDSAGTVTAHKTLVTVPIPSVTRYRGEAKTKANVDTDAELLGLLWDFVLFDLTSSAFTIDETAAADTSGLTIVGGNITKGLLDVIVDARALRTDVA